MIVVVDTSVWSVALRRPSRVRVSNDDLKHVRTLHDLIADARVVLLGIVRQELLSGIKEIKQFRQLRDYLQAFPDVPLNVADYEHAAEMSNTCRSHGIAGPPIDLLICSVACERQWAIYTLDRDFERYAKYLPLRLLH